MKNQTRVFRFEEARAEAAAVENVRRDLAEALGTDDAEIVEGFRLLGLDGDTAEAFSLLPLVYVAWAEGRVSGPERRRILDDARNRGVDEGTAAHETLLGWLEERPDERTFEIAFELIRRTLERTEERQRGTRASRLIGECIRIAKASGGVRGFVGGGDNVCPDEVAALRRVAGYVVT